MTDSSGAHAALRRALADIASRRTLLGAAIAGTAGALGNTQAGDAKKKRKRKKRCKNGAQRCGKACCKAPSICSAASCFCTGNEGNCTSIPAKLIALIAEALDVSPDQIGANPDQPLEACETIPPKVKEQINFEVNKQFGIAEPVNWCEGGIDAGAVGIIGILTDKA